MGAFTAVERESSLKITLLQGISRGERMDYTVLGSPVNLSARLQAMAPANTLVINDATYELVNEYVECEHYEEFTPKGFARPVQVYRVMRFRSEEERARRQQLSLSGQRVEVNVLDSSDIRAAIEELRQIQVEFERQLESNAAADDT